MSRFLKVGYVLRDGLGERIIMRIDAPRDSVELHVPSRNATEHVSLCQLREDLATGKTKSNAPSTILGTLRMPSANSPADRKFQFRVAVVKRINALTAKGQSKGEAIRSLKGTTIEMATGETAPMCSPRQAYRLKDLAEVSRDTLIPGYENRGNRKPRYDKKLEDVVLEHAKNLFAVEKSKITLSKLTDLVTQTARAMGLLGEDSKVSREYVRSIIISQCHTDLDHKRLDPRLAKSAKAVAAKRIRPGCPLNRVEIDTLHLPFLALSDFGVAESLWLMVVIDCETSHPLGWWFMLSSPTTEDTFSCIERAIYPKSALLSKMCIKFEIDPFGAMLNLVLDNGPENAKSRMAAVVKVGINPDWTPIDSGHRKPFVERLNKSLKVALEGLPGCTRFNGKDGARTEEARNDELMTVAELEHWIVRWLFEKWPNTPLERFITADFEIDESLGFTPAQRWRDYESRMVLPICPDIEKWRALRYVEADKTLHHKTGISLDGFDFKGDGLRALIVQYGPSSQVKVHYNPHDYRTIYVPNKQTGEWIELINAEATPRTPAFSFDEAKLRRKAVRETHIKSPGAKAFDSDIAGKTIQQKPGKSRSARLKEAREITRSDQAVKRAEARPLPQTVVPALPPDSHIAADAIPEFSTHQKPPRAKGTDSK